MIAAAPPVPEISVVIPTYNRREVLRICLDALGRQSIAPSCYEVIVGDDGSTDGTDRMVGTVSTTLPMVVRYFRQENSGPGAARNRGLQLARAPLVLILNDDTIATPGLLAEHLRMHSAFPAPEVAILGRVTISPDVPPSIFARLHLDGTFVHFADGEELDWTAFITANLSVKRDFLLAHGLFRAHLFPHEDLELGERLRHRGLRIMYSARALGFHLHHLTESDYLRNATADGRALARWYRLDPALEPILVRFGLNGTAPLRKALRHRVADLVITPSSFPLLLRLARGLAAVHSPSALVLYRKLFKYRSRRAIADELRTVSAAVGALPELSPDVEPVVRSGP